MKLFGGQASRLEVYGLAIAVVVIVFASVGGAVAVTASRDDSPPAAEVSSETPTVTGDVGEQSSAALSEKSASLATGPSQGPSTSVPSTSDSTRPVGDPRCGPFSTLNAAECQALIEEANRRVAEGKAQLERMTAVRVACFAEAQRLNQEVMRIQNLRFAAEADPARSIEAEALYLQYLEALNSSNLKNAECNSLPIPNDRIS